MSDYKVLIDLLRNEKCCKTKDDIEAAVAAIETLLAERDALLDALRGSCNDCVYFEAKKCKEPCVKCYHAQQYFSVPTIDLELSECWEWRGTGGSDGT